MFTYRDCNPNCHIWFHLLFSSAETFPCAAADWSMDISTADKSSACGSMTTVIVADISSEKATSAQPFALFLIQWCFLAKCRRGQNQHKIAHLLLLQCTVHAIKKTSIFYLELSIPCNTSYSTTIKSLL